MERLDRGLVAAAPLPQGTRFVALYFGASWCGPCRAFMPELKRRYPALRARGVEVVFVSDDATCRASRDYVRQERMPWLALPCGDWRRKARVRRSAGAALPGFLVYDSSGRLLITSWRDRGYSQPRRALAQLETLAGTLQTSAGPN